MSAEPWAIPAFNQEKNLSRNIRKAAELRVFCQNPKEGKVSKTRSDQQSHVLQRVCGKLRIEKKLDLAMRRPLGIFVIFSSLIGAGTVYSGEESGSGRVEMTVCI